MQTILVTNSTSEFKNKQTPVVPGSTPKNTLEVNARADTLAHPHRVATRTVRTWKPQALYVMSKNANALVECLSWFTTRGLRMWLLHGKDRSQIFPRYGAIFQKGPLT